MEIKGVLMPQAPRYKNKGSEVAFAILGTPAPLQKQKKRENKKEQKVREQLIYEETSRVR